MGKLAGACIAIAGGQPWWLGGICGAIDGLVGCFAGYYARTRIVKATGGPDWPTPLLEDLIAIGGSLWLVTD